MSPEQTAVRKRHWEMLLVACAVLLLALVLQVHSDDRVAPAGLPGLPLPPTCLSHSLFGVDCPGCGLTRSFVHLAHGDWQTAWQSNRVGPLLALAVLLQFPYRLAGLFGPRDQPLGRLFPKLFGMLLIAALLGNWLLLRFHL